MSFFHFISEFIWTVIFDFLLYGLLGTIAAIVLLVVAKRRFWLKRRFVVGKVLVVLYSILVPLIFGATLAGLATVSDVKEEVHEDVHSVLEPMREAHFPAFQQYINSNILELNEDETVLDEAINEFVDTEANKEGEDSELHGWKGNVTRWGMNHFIDKMLESTEESVGMDDGFISTEFDAIMHLDVDTANHALWEEVEHLVLKQIDKLFGAFYLQILLFWLITMLFPIGETIFANYRRIKREEKMQNTVSE